MPSEAVSDLSKRQIEYLLLVRDGLQSKEIAAACGTTAKAVDNALDRARVTLGVSTRQQAARLVSVSREGSSPEGSIPLANPDYGLQSDRTSNAAFEPPVGVMVGEERVSFLYDLTPGQASAPQPRQASDDVEPRHLSRPLLTAGIYAGVALAIVTLLAVAMETLSRLALRIWPS